MALRRSLQCRAEPLEVHDPKLICGNDDRGNTILTKKTGRFGCSTSIRSISNLKNVIHGSKRHMEKPPSSSPKSTAGSCSELGFGFNGIIDHDRPCIGKTSLGSSTLLLTCHKCSEQFSKWEAVEAHHLSKHAGKNNPLVSFHNLITHMILKRRLGFLSQCCAVTELDEGDSSRKIVQMICQTGCLKNGNNFGHIERILKVHNMQKTIAQFEEYREIVKIKASKPQKKHPRCLADGNELMRFHGTTVECPLGINGSSSLCTSDRCNVCRILRHGFPSKKEMISGGIGVFTASNGRRALEAIEPQENNSLPTGKRALLICRVIAGRVHRPVESFQELSHRSGFESLAGKVGLFSNIEELFSLNPTALLPCFVVIFNS
uniref:C2H2-3 n=1 Tax=Diospyros kaki TaxID=35925 RepID=A0A5P9PAJ6_DIOKA|nr:C2H2-3 [Diospyros kaki]